MGADVSLEAVAKERYIVGLEANKIGDARSALVAFLDAHQRVPKAVYQLSAANMHLKLGEIDSARRAYEMLVKGNYIAEAGQSYYEKLIEQARVKLQLIAQEISPVSSAECNSDEHTDGDNRPVQRRNVAASTEGRALATEMALREHVLALENRVAHLTRRLQEHLKWRLHHGCLAAGTISLEECREAGLSAHVCKILGGCTVQQCKEAGYLPHDCRLAGFTPEECMEAGFTVNEAHDAKYVR
mmetsp:Transcript_20837/g.34371  ORF Transcript_20837/g.34371 Transcript_20837/m.34371 type:complete len:243 (+) Transcript_20837:29-757(+)